MIGSLGILGRAKRLGVLEEVKPSLSIAIANGIHYGENLIARFLREMDEEGL